METDIILVGSGLAACTTAWELHEQNISFIWFADKRPAASMAAYGILNPIHFRNASKGWKDDYFFDAAYQFYLKINQTLGKNIATETPIFHFLNDEKEGILYRQQSECGELGNYSDGEIQFIKHPALQASTHGGIIIKKALHVQIPDYVNQTLTYFEAFKNVINENFDTQQLKVENNIFYNNIIANNIIFCEGKYIENNPLFSYVPLNLSKGEVIEIQTNETLPAFALHKKVFILHQKENQYIVGATTAWNDDTFINTESAKQELEQAASALLNTSFKIIDQRNGIRPAMADRRPIIGTHPQHANVAVLNGMGSKGLFFAPQSAKLLFNHLYNKTEIPFDISIRRFDRRYRTWAEEQKKASKQ